MFSFWTFRRNRKHIEIFRNIFRGHIITSSQANFFCNQEELAHRTERSMRYISLLESCHHQPTLDTLIRLSRALRPPLSQLILEAEQEEENTE